MLEHLIEKEEISSYTILPAEEDKSAFWKEKLEYAVRLGNEFKSKPASLLIPAKDHERFRQLYGR